MIVETCGQFYQHAYAQLLQAKIPKAQKDSHVISVFLCFWDQCTKAACKIQVQLVSLENYS